MSRCHDSLSCIGQHRGAFRRETKVAHAPSAIFALARNLEGLVFQQGLLAAVGHNRPVQDNRHPVTPTTCLRQHASPAQLAHQLRVLLALEPHSSLAASGTSSARRPPGLQRHLALLVRGASPFSPSMTRWKKTPCLLRALEGLLPLRAAEQRRHAAGGVPPAAASRSPASPCPPPLAPPPAGRCGRRPPAAPVVRLALLQRLVHVGQRNQRLAVGQVGVHRAEVAGLLRRGIARRGR